MAASAAASRLLDDIDSKADETRDAAVERRVDEIINVYFDRIVPPPNVRERVMGIIRDAVPGESR